MRVLFRTDASLSIGTGHVMRCLTLAQALTRQGARCRFVMRKHAGHRGDAVEEAGFPVELLSGGTSDKPTEAKINPPGYAHWLGADWAEDVEQFQRAAGTSLVDWVVVDHYALDRRWEGAAASLARHLLVVDDLADRPHQCDILLDQNLGRQKKDYVHLTPTNCRHLIGPQHALLRTSFAAVRPQSLQRRQNGDIQRILVSMGGVDASDATGISLKALDRVAGSADLEVDVVMGKSAPHLAHIRNLAARVGFDCNVHVDTSEMPALMAKADLAFGAAGSSAWERCAVGLPTLLVVIADNQWPGAKALALAGAACLVGTGNDISTNLLGAWHKVQDPTYLLDLSTRAAAICDGLGTGRVVETMEQLS